MMNSIKESLPVEHEAGARDWQSEEPGHEDCGHMGLGEMGSMQSVECLPATTNKSNDAGYSRNTGIRRRKQFFAQRRKAVESYAVYLGMDVEQDKELLWLAEEGLFAPLPGGWKEYRDIKGQPYFYDTTTKTSSWHHPKDVEYRQKYLHLKSIQRKVCSARTPSGTPQIVEPGDSKSQISGKNSRRKSKTTLQMVAAWLVLFLIVGAFLGFIWICRAAIESVKLDGNILHTFRQLAGLFGSVDSQFQVGGSYLQGTHTIKNSQLAMHWFKMAAENGHAVAQRMCGILLSKGYDDAKPDQDQAGEYFSRAAAQGDLVSMAMIGFMHYTGTGKPLDYQAAQIWTQRSAERGEPNAMLTYAVMFLEGKALSRNARSAYKWLLLAQRHAGDSQTIATRVTRYIEHAKADLNYQDEKQAEREADLFVAKK